MKKKNEDKSVIEKSSPMINIEEFLQGLSIRPEHKAGFKATVKKAYATEDTWHNLYNSYQNRTCIERGPN